MRPVTQPLVSVIITTKNSGKTLRELLQSLKYQTYKKIEILIIDNNSTDDTCAIANKFTGKVFLKGPERSAQRNLGARLAKGKYLLILDSDMVLTPEVIGECVFEIERQHRLQALIIPEKSYGEGFWAKTKVLERELNRNEDYFEAARFFSRKAFWEVGGYDEKLTGPEDWDLPQRIMLKYGVGRVKNIILHNEGHPSLFSLAKRKYYYGLSVHNYLKKQKLPLFTKKTVYFLRSGFYRNWKKILTHPVISGGMLIMLIAETLGGGLGYLVGRFKNG